VLAGAFAALAVGERRKQAFEAARRFFLRRRERPRLDEHREQQRALADKLEEQVRRHKEKARDHRAFEVHKHVPAATQ